MQLLRWKTQWIPLQIYALIVGLKVKELFNRVFKDRYKITPREYRKRRGLINKSVVVNDRVGKR